VVVEKLKQELTAQRIYQDLVDEHQFVGSYQSVKRFVRRLEATSIPLPMRRMECAAGFEAQVDYGTGARVIDAEGKHRKTNVFRIVLSHSRKAYSEATFRQTTDDFIRSLENAFWSFGGVPQTLVIDNLRAAVKHADWYDPELNPKLRSFCQHYGVAILPTRPYTPRHKGKIERGVGYVKSNSLKGRVFKTLAEQNEHLDRWEQSVADTRIHGTTRQHVGQVFVEVERPALRPLPLERFPCFHEAQRKVSRDGHVEVARAYYSVPPEYLGHTVWVRWDARLVRVFNQQMHQITLHVRHEPGKFSTQDAHIAPEKIHGVERGVEFQMKKVRLIGPATTAWAEAMLVARGIEGTRVLLGVIALTKKHTVEAIEGACRVALSHGEFGVRAIRLLAVKQPEAVQATLPFLDEHPLIRPLDDYAQTVADALQRKSDRVAAKARPNGEPMPQGNSGVRLQRHDRANEFVVPEHQNPDGENHQGSRDISDNSRIHPPGSGYSLPGCSPAEPDSASPDHFSLRPLFPPLPGEFFDESAE
jgi:transposase